MRAVDSSGIRDPSPARFEWRVENNSTTTVSPSNNISSLQNTARNITASNSTITGNQSGTDEVPPVKTLATGRAQFDLKY